MAQETDSRQIKKSLEVDLTKEEMSTMLARAGELQADVEAKKKAFKEVQGEHNKAVKEANAEIHMLLAAGHEGKQIREVEATITRNFNAAEVTIEYNGKVYERRAMTENELQGDMFEADSADEEEEELEDDAEVPVDEQIAEDIKKSTSRKTASSAVV